MSWNVRHVMYSFCAWTRAVLRTCSSTCHILPVPSGGRQGAPARPYRLDGPAGTLGTRHVPILACFYCRSGGRLGRASAISQCSASSIYPRWAYLFPATFCSSEYFTKGVAKERIASLISMPSESASSGVQSFAKAVSSPYIPNA